MSRVLAVLFSSVVLWAAFPPFNCPFLAWAALVPLFLALDRARSDRLAFGLGFLSGLGFFLSAFSWIHYVTIPGFVVLSAYCALYFGVFGAFYSWLRPRVDFFVFSVLVSAAWVVLEYVRATVLTGFGWASLGHTQASFDGLMPLASFTGVPGISFLIVWVNNVFKEALGGFRKKAVWLAGGILLAGLGLAVAGSAPGYYVKPAEGFKAALIQPNIALAEAWNPLLGGEIIRRQIALSREALAEGPQLVIWPETSFPNFIWDRPDLLEEVKSFARANRVYLLFGAVTRAGAAAPSAASAAEKYFNSAVLISPLGDIIAIRSKRHLVVFGEYIPLRKELPFLQKFVPIDDFTPAGQDALFDAPGLGRFGVLICFEDTFPAISRRYTLKGAGFLVNMTNDAWFRDSGQPAMHLDNARFRSVENARPLLRATNTGETCAMDAAGREGACVQDNQGRRVLKEGFVVTSVYPEVKMTWYTKCGDWFVLVCVMVLAAGLLAAFRRKKTAVSGSRKILLIDDERSLHIMLKSVLGSYGFEVISAMNGEEGLALAASENPGLILLDVILPTIKGREVCKRLKASPETARIPVLFLTAKDSDDDVKGELEAGAVGHVSKPVNASSLVRLIRKTMAL